MADQYGRHVAALRCATILQLGDEDDGPIELRLEDPRFAPWDDITELHRQADGERVQHVWQVKRQRTRLERASFEALLRALHANPLVWAHLAVPRLGEVEAVGSLLDLESLTERLRQPGFDMEAELEPTAEEARWVRCAAQLTGVAEGDALKLLQRLEVNELGLERHIKQQALQLLKPLYPEPLRAHERLLAFLSDHTDSPIRFTAAFLEHTVLAGIEQRQQPRAASRRTQRLGYLNDVIEGYGRRVPLRLLAGQGVATRNATPLSDVFCMPALRSAAQEESPGLSPSRPKLRGNVRLASEEEEEGVRTDAQRRLASPEDLRLDELLLDENRLVERPRYLVEGAVGAGKSTLLEHLRFRLAQRALQEEEAPLPVLLDARELSAGLESALARAWPPLAPGRAEPGRVVYLVDALDEVERQHADIVTGWLERISTQASTVAMVMVSRPALTFVTPPPDAIRLRIAPWTRSQIDDFLERWRAREPQRVEALLHVAHNDALLPLLSSPLTATFALMLAQDDPAALKSRAGLFHGIAQRLFADWAKRRAPAEASVERAWSRRAPGLRRLAWEMLRSGHDSFSAGELRRHLGHEAFDEAGEWVDDAHRYFGLLVVDEEERFRFVLRGLAEHLAGAALLAAGETSIVEAAQEQWAEEPVRHALGLGAERYGPNWALERIRALLPSASKVKIGDLRPLMVAARVAVDLGRDAAGIAQTLASDLYALLTLETSVWIGRVVAAAVHDLARAGGPCWDALAPMLYARLEAQGSPADWFRAQSDESLEFWLIAVAHREPEARCAVMERLSRWGHDEQAREVLLNQCLDPTDVFFGQPPALKAGLVLREVARDANFQSRLLPLLLTLLQSDDEMESSAACLALHPSEAPIALLAKRMAGLAESRHSYPSVLQELSASPGGAAALDVAWPEWRGALSTSHLSGGSPQAPRSAVAPPSRPGRQLVLHALGPAAARLPAAERVTHQPLLVSREVTEALCEAAWDEPDAMVFRLREAEPLVLSPAGEQRLGEAAIRHPALRAALMDSWRRCGNENERGFFPAGALSALVARGDQEAADVFAQWLQVTYWLRSPFSPLILSAAALRHPAVQPVAIRKALDAWSQYSDGWLEDGQRFRIPGTTLANVLGSLRPAWEGHSDIASRLMDSAQTGGEGLTDAMSVYARPPYPLELSDLLCEHFAQGASMHREEEPWVVGFWIGWAERAATVSRLRAPLEDILHWESWLRYRAAAALIAAHPSRAAEISRRAAADWPSEWVTQFLPSVVLRRLVRAEVGAWESRFHALIQKPSLPINPLFELARALAPLLPEERRDALHLELYRRLGRRAGHWTRRGRESWDTIHLPDLFAQVVFEGGGRLAKR